MAATPLVVAVGFSIRPYVSDFTNNQLVARVIADSPNRWLGGGLLMAGGALLLAFALPTAVERVGGGDRRRRTVRAAATVSAVLLALQVGLFSVGAAAASKIDADVPAYLDNLSVVEITILLFGLTALLVAWVGVARAVWSSGLSPTIKWIVLAGALSGALGHLYPGSPGEYVAAAGTAAALWPLVPKRPHGTGRSK